MKKSQKRPNSAITAGRCRRGNTVITDNRHSMSQSKRSMPFSHTNVILLISKSITIITMSCYQTIEQFIVELILTSF